MGSKEQLTFNSHAHTVNGIILTLVCIGYSVHTGRICQPAHLLGKQHFPFSLPSSVLFCLHILLEICRLVE